MRKAYFLLLLAPTAIVWACGGSDNTTIDGGSDATTDTSTGDSSPPGDSGTNDANKNDGGPGDASQDLNINITCQKPANCFDGGDPDAAYPPDSGEVCCGTRPDLGNFPELQLQLGEHHVRCAQHVRDEDRAPVVRHRHRSPLLRRFGMHGERHRADDIQQVLLDAVPRRGSRALLREHDHRRCKPGRDHLPLRLIYATRKSALALAQSRAFVSALRASNEELELVEKQVTTSGDRIQDRPLSEVGGKGLFTKEIEEALLDASADFAVHSIKDVPAALPNKLQIACIPKREDPRDVLVAPKWKTLGALPKGATIGTSSLRRAVSLRAARPDLVIVPLRGNVDTRLRKVEAGEADAIVLARAGLVRLGLEARATSVLEPDVSLPAVGQGALGIEAREGDERVFSALKSLHDANTATCVFAERGVMAALEGDCKTPLAAYAERVGDDMVLAAFVAEPDGSRHRSARETIPWPTSEHAAEAFGRAVGTRLR